ncbi:MAG: type III pantothenate kinase [Cyanobium sp.]
MKASEVAGPGSGGAPPPRWLLIGNARWHWAASKPGGPGLLLWHTPPPGPELSTLAAGLRAWAAVGPLPVGSALPPSHRLTLASVPLAGAPAWLGVDRALAGWQAWCLAGGPVLVADAGTVLSLTRVRGDGSFVGGRLLAGAALQWRAMGAGTALLPCLDPQGPLPEPFAAESGNAWPQATEAAMRQGVIAGLTAAVADGFLEARRDEPQLRLLLCGGDGPSLQPGLHRRLAAEGLAARLWHRPALALEALEALAPDQASSRSARI